MLFFKRLEVHQAASEVLMDKIPKRTAFLREKDINSLALFMVFIVILL